MIRKTIVALAAAAALGALALAPTAASARPWHGHGAHRHHHHHHGHPHFRAFRFYGPVFASCWRWVPTRFGYAKVWVCG
jgi:hypothetical protein